MADEHPDDRHAALDDAIDRVLRDMTHTRADAGADRALLGEQGDAAATARVMARLSVVTRDGWRPRQPLLPRAAWAVAATMLLAAVAGYWAWTWTPTPVRGPDAGTHARSGVTPASPAARAGAPRSGESEDAAMPASTGTAQRPLARAPRGDSADSSTESDAWTSDLRPPEGDLAVDDITPTPLEGPAALAVAPLRMERVAVEPIPVEPAKETETAPDR